MAPGRLPFHTLNPALAVLRDGRTMVALASWAKDKVDVRLAIGWKALGLDPKELQAAVDEAKALLARAMSSGAEKP